MSTQPIVTVPNLGPEFELGTTVASQITIAVDGQTVVRDAGTGELSSPVTSLTYDNTSTTLSFLDEEGNTTTIDLSSLTTDIFVNGGSFDAATSTLTLTDNDAATPDVTIDLSTLLGVSVDVDNILSNGTDGKAFLSCENIKDDCTSVCQDAFGNDLFFAFEV